MKICCVYEFLFVVAYLALSGVRKHNRKLMQLKKNFSIETKYFAFMTKNKPPLLIMETVANWNYRVDLSSE